MTRSPGLPFFLVVAAGLALALAAAPAAAADARDEEGKRLYRRGQELLKAGDFRGAAELFEAGYAASPRPGFLLNIGNCHRKLGELAKARQYYWKFLETAPKKHPSRADVVQYLRAIEQIESDGLALEGAAAARAEAPAVAEPTVATEVRPEPAPVLLPAPPPAKPAVDLRQPASPPPARASGGSRWWVWTLVGAAVAGGAVAFAVTRNGDGGCRGSLGCLNE